MDMPAIRLLDLSNLVALSPARDFFNGLLADRLLDHSSSFTWKIVCVLKTSLQSLLR